MNVKVLGQGAFGFILLFSDNKNTCYKVFNSESHKLNKSMADNEIEFAGIIAKYLEKLMVDIKEGHPSFELIKNYFDFYKSYERVEFDADKQKLIKDAGCDTENLVTIKMMRGLVSLHKYIEENEEISFDNIAKQLVFSLLIIISSGSHHGDIKPENIMLLSSFYFTTIDNRHPDHCNPPLHYSSPMSVPTNKRKKTSHSIANDALSLGATLITISTRNFVFNYLGRGEPDKVYGLDKSVVEKFTEDKESNESEKELRNLILGLITTDNNQKLGHLRRIENLEELIEFLNEDECFFSKKLVDDFREKVEKEKAQLKRQIEEAPAFDLLGSIDPIKLSDSMESLAPNEQMGAGAQENINHKNARVRKGKRKR